MVTRYARVFNVYIVSRRRSSGRSRCDQKPLRIAVLTDRISLLFLASLRTFRIRFVIYGPCGDMCLDSPIPDVETALYRFTDPAVPGVIMPLAGNSSPGDIQLNQGNPIVQLDGSDVEIGCNGDIVSQMCLDACSQAQRICVFDKSVVE